MEKNKKDKEFIDVIINELFDMDLFKDLQTIQQEFNKGRFILRDEVKGNMGPGPCSNVTLDSDVKKTLEAHENPVINRDTEKELYALRKKYKRGFKSQIGVRKAVCEILHAWGITEHWKNIQSLRIYTGGIRIFYVVGESLKYVDMRKTLIYLDFETLYKATQEIFDDVVSTFKYE